MFRVTQNIFAQLDPDFLNWKHAQQFHSDVIGESLDQFVRARAGDFFYFRAHFGVVDRVPNVVAKIDECPLGPKSELNSEALGLGALRFGDADPHRKLELLYLNEIGGALHASSTCTAVKFRNPAVHRTGPPMKAGLLREIFCGDPFRNGTLRNR